MSNPEFSDNFDVLINSYAATISFGDDSSRTLSFTEYEKSVYLTNAQEEIVLELYTGKNPYKESFEQTEELRRYLANLVCEDNPKEITNRTGNPLGAKNNKFYALPDGKETESEGVEGEGEEEEVKPAVWFITYENVEVTGEGVCGEDNTAIMDVLPVKQDEYNKIKRNPFRGANNRRALRLDLSDGVVEIISKYPISNYYVRYLRKPNPIVLVNLEAEGLTINGEDEITPCELHEALHKKILERAVLLALKSKGYTIKQND